jgi:hypothetical protein
MMKMVEVARGRPTQVCWTREPLPPTYVIAYTQQGLHGNTAMLLYENLDYSPVRRREGYYISHTTRRHVGEKRPYAALHTDFQKWRNEVIIGFEFDFPQACRVYCSTVFYSVSSEDILVALRTSRLSINLDLTMAMSSEKLSTPLSAILGLQAGLGYLRRALTQNRDCRKETMDVVA